MVQPFSGTDHHIVTDDLMMTVNAAITLERPLLIKGEPEMGKTQLVQDIARWLQHLHLRAAHQVDQEGAAGSVGLRCGVSLAHLAAPRACAHHDESMIRAVWEVHFLGLRRELLAEALRGFCKVSKSLVQRKGNS